MSKLGVSLGSRKRIALTVLICFAAFMMVSSVLDIVQAQTQIRVTEVRVTSSSAHETLPRLGNDGISDIVVYMVHVWMGNYYSPCDIWYQRLFSGWPYGPAIQVTNTAADEWARDTSGDYIVYTAYDSVGSLTGEIRLYQISTGVVHVIGSATVMGVPYIHGNFVVWYEGTSPAVQIMLYDLSWLGTSQNAIILAGPGPLSYDLEIGSRFAVWAEYSYSSEQFDIVAYDLEADAYVQVTSTPTTDEKQPSTWGEWIVWEAHEKGATSTRIEARNMDTDEERVVVDNGAINFRPSIDGALISYESAQMYGNFDIFLYILDTGETFQVTTDPNYQGASHIFDNLVAYIYGSYNDGIWDEDVYVSSFSFGRPDLIVESLSHFPANPTTADTITFTAIVKNVGDAVAGPSTLAFRVGGETPGGNVPLFSIPALQPGETFTVQRHEILDVAQNYQNTATADVLDEVAESNETNNVTVDFYTVTMADNAPPLTTISLFGTLGSNDWYTSDVTVALTATDDFSGVANTKYSLDGTTWSTYTSSFTITTEGTSTLQYYSTDNAGNTENTKTKTIKIDKTQPNIIINEPLPGDYYNFELITIDFIATDATSGIDTTTALLDSTLVSYGQTIDLSTLSLGTHTLTVTATDVAGLTVTQQVTFNIIPLPTSIDVTKQLNRDTVNNMGRGRLVSKTTVINTASPIIKIEDIEQFPDSFTLQNLVVTIFDPTNPAYKYKLDSTAYILQYLIGDTTATVTVTFPITATLTYQNPDGTWTTLPVTLNDLPTNWIIQFQYILAPPSTLLPGTYTTTATVTAWTTPINYTTDIATATLTIEEKKKP